VPLRILIDFIDRFGVIGLFSLLFILVNLFTFSVYWVDKRKAVKNKWRISERTLILFTLAGGGIGALFGMSLLRHKTRKVKFKFALVMGLMIVVFVLYIFFIALKCR
jgi:uncharacterized membrane protein YsdA (DUF1294 family)